nr:hypothetical protein GCM10020092_058850 [Actinoplanes digitatis]
MARVRLAEGDYPAVEEILRPLTQDIQYAHSTGAALPEALLTLSEAHRLAGRFATAQADLDHVRRLAHERDLRAAEAAMLEQQAVLHAAMGSSTARPTRRTSSSTGSSPSSSPRSATRRPARSRRCSRRPRPGGSASTSASWPTATR